MNEGKKFFFYKYKYNQFKISLHFGGICLKAESHGTSFKNIIFKELFLKHTLHRKDVLKL